MSTTNPRSSRASGLRARHRRARSGCALLILTAAALALVACSVKPPVTVRPSPRTDRWDTAAMRAAQPCFVTASEEPSSTLLAVPLGPAGGPRPLWTPDPHERVRLLDASETGPMLLIASAPRAGTGRPERLLLLTGEGAVREVDRGSPGWPLVGCAAFGTGDSLVAVRMAQSTTSIDTTLSILLPAEETWRPVTLVGSWPDHHYIGGLLRLAEPNAYVAILKTQGTPAPNDDYVAVPAKLDGTRLLASGEPYADDCLFAAGPGPLANSIVFPRTNGSAVGPRTDLVLVRWQSGPPVERVLLADSQCDPGFDYERVCAGIEGGATAFRPSRDAQSSGTPELRRLAAGETTATPFGLTFPPLGSQWLWVTTP